jgi:hypothetical protein
MGAIDERHDRGTQRETAADLPPDIPLNSSRFCRVIQGMAQDMTKRANKSQRSNLASDEAAVMLGSVYGHSGAGIGLAVLTRCGLVNSETDGLGAMRAGEAEFLPY